MKTTCRGGRVATKDLWAKLLAEKVPARRSQWNIRDGEVNEQDDAAIFSQLTVHIFI